MYVNKMSGEAYKANLFPPIFLPKQIFVPHLAPGLVVRDGVQGWNTYIQIIFCWKKLKKFTFWCGTQHGSCWPFQIPNNKERNIPHWSQTIILLVPDCERWRPWTGSPPPVAPPASRWWAGFSPPPSPSPAGNRLNFNTKSVSNEWITFAQMCNRVKSYLIPVNHHVHVGVDPHNNDDNVKGVEQK